jgi:hypothetical protein
MGQGEGLIVRNHLPCPAVRPLSLFCCHHVHFSTKHQMHSSVRVVDQTMSRPIGYGVCANRNRRLLSRAGFFSFLLSTSRSILV